ncbi:Aspartate aminotransferase (EC [Olavius algarvensis Delta 1 endosymbiont]|nr:Aspartate aminotransferase (EC [Olavius algarvensis Delta 1 endosymbiont]
MSDISLAPSLVHVAPSQIRAIADVAFPMEGVLKLHFGESNLQTPQYLKDAAYQAMNEGYTFYSENAGLPALRTAIAAKYAELHQIDLNAADEILITASGVQALNVSIRCVIDPGDEALVLTPNWPNGSAIVSLFGGSPRELPLSWNGVRYEIDFAALENALTPKTRLLIYASPSNPLGWVADVAEQQALLDFCRRHELWLLADEVYERIYYGGEVAPSILRLCTRDDAVIVVQSFSKSYCMTGWRLGWVVARRDLIIKAAQLNEFIVSHAPSMIQRAGIKALQQGEEDISTMVKSLRGKVDFCYEAFHSMKGVSVARPEGAFYLFAQIAEVDDSYSFALRLLEETRVAVAPGVAFGNGGEGAVRICCAADMSILEEAIERIGNFLAKILK